MSKRTQKRDKYKMRKATKNGYSIIRILQKDVYYNKNAWESTLINQIHKYKQPTVMCNGNEYTCYKKFINKMLCN